MSRHRIGTDGCGVRTLVSFYGCPLACRYCINRELLASDPGAKWYEPSELLSELGRDNYYFLTTGGGVTFSGGEPLLHADFISEFCSLCDPDWGLAVETSLNVPLENVAKVAACVDTFIVDVKDVNPATYSAYTGGDLSRVLENLQYLKDEFVERCGHEVILRVPLIPGYNTRDDVMKAVEFLMDRYHGVFGIDLPTYVTSKDDAPVPDGKRICRILKAIRAGLIRDNALGIVQPVCTHRGNCPGTCPVCDAELDAINRKAADAGEDFNYYRTMAEIEDRYARALSFEPGIASNRTELMGMPQDPRTLMGDVCLPEFDKRTPDDENL